MRAELYYASPYAWHSPSRYSFSFARLCAAFVAGVLRDLFAAVGVTWCVSRGRTFATAEAQTTSVSGSPAFAQTEHPDLASRTVQCTLSSPLRAVAKTPQLEDSQTRLVFDQRDANWPGIGRRQWREDTW